MTVCGPTGLPGLPGMLIPVRVVRESSPGTVRSWKAPTVRKVTQVEGPTLPQIKGAYLSKATVCWKRGRMLGEKTTMKLISLN